MATLRILSRWRRGAATLSCSTPRHLSTTSALLNRPFENPLHRMKSAEQLELEGFEMPYAWPYKEKQYRWYHSTLDRDPTVWKFYENSKLILIEGNVGVGKTRLGEQLAKYFNMKFMSDDTLLDMQDEYDVFWPQKDYNSILPFIMQRFYRHQFMENPFDIRAARMQCDMLRSRFYQYFLAMLHILSTGQGVVLERSIFSDFVFTEAMRQMNYISKRARYYYYELHQNSVPDQRLLKPHLVIYLDAPVDVCLDRIKGRNRPYEVNSPVLTPEYLERIEKEYRDTYIPSLSRWCDVKAFDWRTIGDADAVAEEIERYDFQQYKYYFEGRLNQWRFNDKDWEWDEHRVFYANFVFNVQKFFDIENVIAPEMNQSYYAWNEWQLIKAEVLRRRDPKANVDEDDLWGKVKNAFTA